MRSAVLWLGGVGTFVPSHTYLLLPGARNLTWLPRLAEFQTAFLSSRRFF